MKIIKASAEILNYKTSTNILKTIELAGRVCYKSEDKITDESAKNFIEKIIKRKHGAVLEHGIFVLEILDEDIYAAIESSLDNEFLRFINMTNINKPLISFNVRAIRELFFNCLEKDKEESILIMALIKKLTDKDSSYKHLFSDILCLYPTSIKNNDKIVELNEVKKLIKKLENLDQILKFDLIEDWRTLDKEEQIHHGHITFKVITDRAVSNEIVRHRIASYAQESTRYCVAHDTKLTFMNPHYKYTVADLYNKKINSKNGSWKRIKIKHLNEKTGELIYSPIKNIYYNGEKEVYEVKTKLGYTLKCTLDHKIFSENGYKELGHLKIGSNIFINGKNISSELLYRDKDWLFYQNITLNKTFVEISKEFNFNVSTLKNWARKFRIPKKGTGYFNKGKIPWNKGLSENDDNRVKKQANILRTFHYDSSKKGIKIMKKNTVNYQKHMKSHCEICGIKNNLEVHHIDNNRSNNYPENLITTCKSCHQRIHYKNLEIIYLDEIVSINKIGIEKVYDIEMHDYHNFVANGVIVHNCNYSKDKFGNELTFIQPCFWDLDRNIHYKDMDDDLKNKWKNFHLWQKQIEDAENRYLKMIENGATPQEARSILPNSLKTEIVITMNIKELKLFFNLRCAKSAHPQMQEVANIMLQLYNDIIEGGEIN
jgi:thymidylate synthase ThyX/DNA-directed RNA polymerase subunit M/transcription elongation factor TFIIS